MPDPGGYGFSKEGAQRIIRATKGFESSAGSGGGGAAPNATGTNQVIEAQLTSRDATDSSLYAWSQVRRNASTTGTVWDTVAGGLSGTASNRPAIDTSDPGARVDQTNRYVLLARGTYNKAGTITPCWYIVGDLAFPTPRPKYSVLMPINDSGDLAFDRPRFA